MKCHYEVLGLELDCTDDDLKKAYRKLALEWHPDKNLERLEEAKENFLLIQQAYEILSDPQERAWYDRHREDILRGGAEQAYKDNCVDVCQYYNTSCFKGYNDEEKGFYTVYRQVFEKITAEDKPFMDDDEDMEVPQFGYSYSSYEEVVHNFYAYWQSYCTAKTFSWEDKFDLTEARKSGVGRQVIRAMEKENKKIRDAHKKLRNEEVRALVAFVRKRDKRVQAQKKIMEKVKAEKAKKAEELRRKQVQERNKALEDYEETEWSSMSQFEDHFNEIESTLDATFGDNIDDASENEEDEDLGDLYCVACEKDFRSDKAFKNHENSKKHKENVLLLTTLMVEEEAEISAAEKTEDNNEISEITPVESEPEESISSEALLDELIKKSTKSKKKKKKSKATAVIDGLPDATDKLEEMQLEMDNIQIVDRTSPADEDKDLSAQCATESALSKKKKKKKASKSETNVAVENEESVEKKETDNLDKIIEMENSQNSEMVSPANEQNDVSSKPASKSVSSKKKGKKDKTPKTEADSMVENEDSTEKAVTICGTCNNNFSSRNKLFEHLKQTGHALYKNGNQASGSSGKKQRKKKL